MGSRSKSTQKYFYGVFKYNNRRFPLVVAYNKNNLGDKQIDIPFGYAAMLVDMGSNLFIADDITLNNNTLGGILEQGYYFRKED